jgi:hypothetical protein
MPLPLSWRRNDASTQSLIVVIQYFALAGLLSACASATPWRIPTTPSSPGDSHESSECSFVGRLACAAMAMGSREGAGNRQGTCTASRSGSTYVETCGTSSAPAQLLQPEPQTATAGLSTSSRSSVQLTWTDNSNNETGFVIERCDQIFRDARSEKMTVSCRGAWKTVGTVVANITTYVDETVTANQTYIYRVKATNQFGSSAYTPEAVITAPVK